MRKSEQVVASKHQSMALIGQRINSRNRLRSIVSIRWKRFKHLAGSRFILLGRLTVSPRTSVSETARTTGGPPAPYVSEALAG